MLFDQLSHLPQPIISAALTITTALLVQLLRPKAKIHFAVTHGFTHVIRQQPPTGASPATVNTRTLLFRNIGRGVAQDLEIVLNWKPLQYEVWPQRRYHEELNPDGRLVIKVDSLNSWEFFALELIDAKELPFLLSVRCRDGSSKEVRMAPTRMMPNWFNALVFLLLLLGLYQVIAVALPVAGKFF